MSRLRSMVAAVAVAGAAVTSCGATMQLSGTAPRQDNAGTCAAPVLVAMDTTDVRAMLVMHFRWTGPSTGEDSLTMRPGRPFTFIRTVPPGTYTVRAWPSDRGGVGCDTTVTHVVKAPPDKVRVLQ